MWLWTSARSDQKRPQSGDRQRRSRFRQHPLSGVSQKPLIEWSTCPVRLAAETLYSSIGLGWACKLEKFKQHLLRSQGVDVPLTQLLLCSIPSPWQEIYQLVPQSIHLRLKHAYRVDERNRLVIDTQCFGSAYAARHLTFLTPLDEVTRSHDRNGMCTLVQFLRHVRLLGSEEYSVLLGRCLRFQSALSAGFPCDFWIETLVNQYSIVVVPPPVAKRGPSIPGGLTPDFQASYWNTAGSSKNPRPPSRLQSAHNCCCAHRGGCALATAGHGQSVARGVIIEFRLVFCL